MSAPCAHRKAPVSGNPWVCTGSSNNETSYPWVLQSGTLSSDALQAHTRRASVLTPPLTEKGLRWPTALGPPPPFPGGVSGKAPHLSKGLVVSVISPPPLPRAVNRASAWRQQLAGRDVPVLPPFQPSACPHSPSPARVGPVCSGLLRTARGAGDGPHHDPSDDPEGVGLHGQTPAARRNGTAGLALLPSLDRCAGGRGECRRGQQRAVAAPPIVGEFTPPRSVCRLLGGGGGAHRQWCVCAGRRGRVGRSLAWPFVGMKVPPSGDLSWHVPRAGSATARRWRSMAYQWALAASPTAVRQRAQHFALRFSLQFRSSRFFAQTTACGPDRRALCPVLPTPVRKPLPPDPRPLLLTGDQTKPR